MSSRDKQPEQTYQPPVAEDLETSAGPVATAPAEDGTVDDTTTVTPGAE